MSRSCWCIIVLALGMLTACAWYAQVRAAENVHDANNSSNKLSDEAFLEDINNQESDSSEVEYDQVIPNWEKQHSARDLIAQEGMAKWTFWILIVTGINVVVTVAGVILVYFTLKHSRRAADAAFDMVEEAKATTEAAKGAALAAFNQATTADNASRRLERPYLFPKVEHVGGLHNPGARNIAHIKIRLHNHGRLPATLVSINTRLVDHPETTSLILSASSEQRFYEIIETGGRSDELIVHVEGAREGKSWNGNEAKRLVLLFCIEYLGPFGARHIDRHRLRFLHNGSNQIQEGDSQYNYRETIEPEDMLES